MCCRRLRLFPSQHLLSYLSNHLLFCAKCLILCEYLKWAHSNKSHHSWSYDFFTSSSSCISVSPVASDNWGSVVTVPAPGSHQVKSSPPGRPAASGLSESCAAAKHKLGQRLHIERAHGFCIQTFKPSYFYMHMHAIVPNIIDSLCVSYFHMNQ